MTATAIEIHPKPDLSFIDKLVGELGTGPELLLPILQRIMVQYRYLPQDALIRVCELTAITPSTIIGVATFYDQFRMSPAGKNKIQFCMGTACYVKGAGLVLEALERELGLAEGEDTDADMQFTIEKVACLGCCTLAPVAQIEEEIYGHIGSEQVGDVLTDFYKRQKAGKTDIPEQTLDEERVQGELWVGLDSCCVARGSEKVYKALYDALDQTGTTDTVRVKHVSCVGICYLTPMIEVVKPGAEPIRYGPIAPEDVLPIVRRHFKPRNIARRVFDAVNRGLDGLLTDEGEPVEKFAVNHEEGHAAAFYAPQKMIATELSGVLDPLDIDEYIAHAGFEGAKKALLEMTPEEIIDTVKASGLRGRGGGGFPTWFKWGVVRKAEADQKYVICNGDEGDPGAFMDRMLLESYSYRVVEGMMIAARAVGATKGYLYIRAEYPLAVKRMGQMLDLLRERGLLGKNIFGSGLDLDLQIIAGAGAFICGEETAMIESIEGRRGIPQLRPPYPAESGLWDKPTLINNVETFSMLSWILRHGGEAYAELGTEKSKGTKVFSLTGKVKNGGLIEVPMGITLSDIVNKIGGGVEEGRTFKAVQIGGPSGGCIPAALCETTPVDYEALKEAGAMMGSGGLVVMDDKDCVVDIARYFIEFTQDQSCGKCTPCRVGTRRMLEILERICAGKGRKKDLDALEELSEMVGPSSLCGLGMTAPNPVLTTLKYFREEYEAHLEGRCPAASCKALNMYTINETCIGCTRCAQYCPTDAIPQVPYELHEIIQDRCISCDMCRVVCPVDAVEVH